MCETTNPTQTTQRPARDGEAPHTNVISYYVLQEEEGEDLRRTLARGREKELCCLAAGDEMQEARDRRSGICMEGDGLVAQTLYHHCLCRRNPTRGRLIAASGTDGSGLHDSLRSWNPSSL